MKVPLFATGMNSRLVLLFCLLMCGALVASAHSKSTIVRSEAKAFVIKSATEFPAHSRSATGDTFITKTHDVATNATAVPAIVALLVVIAIIGSFDSSDSLRPSRPPGRTIFFKVLFRSIISPNAP